MELSKKALVVNFVVLSLALAIMMGEASNVHMLNHPVGRDDLIEDENEFMLDSEESRRVLVDQSPKYISYGALRSNQVPCGWHGRSYYDCNNRQRANPYNRGCSRITNCQRTIKA